MKILRTCLLRHMTMTLAERWAGLVDRALDFGHGTSAQFFELTVEGTFLIAGKASVSDMHGKTWVVRVDTDGHIAPEHSLVVPDMFDLSAFTTTAEGGFLVTGNVFIGPEKGSDEWIGCLSADGKPQWSRKLGIAERNAVVKEAADRRQEQSKPALERLFAWIDEQFDKQ